MNNALELPRSERYVVCLIDGLGWEPLQDNIAEAPFLREVSDRFIIADFPTTTPVGLAALGTGLAPGEHGVVGASFWLPEIEGVLAPLHWPQGAPPEMVQPEPTIFELLARLEIEAVSVGAAAYATSGLTQAVLRGSTYLSADTSQAIVQETANSSGACTYVYWSALDRVGHAHGVSSAEWRAELRIVDTLLRDLVAAMLPGTTVVVTADHGMLDSSPAYRRSIDESALLRHGVRLIAGEPRLRHVYFDEPVDGSTVDIWRTELSGVADVFTREEAFPLFGTIAPGIEERIGDLVCVARDRWVLTSHVDPRVSGFPGQHGALSDAERHVPGIVVTT
jgi:hypothetical protein